MSTTEAERLDAPGKSGERDGATLQAVMEAARRLDELSCARVVGNIADAVHAAQKAGQPIAALTPPAIVVAPDGGVTFAAAAAAVPRYLAPEKLRGAAGDRRSDVFALGVMLWEALAHEPLFSGGDDDAVRRAVLEAPIRPPSELNANVPAELDAICKRALARDPADRYQSARVMAADIEAVLGDAGYPESNEQIARFLAAMAAPPAKPMANVAPRAASQPATTLQMPMIHAPVTQPPARRPASQPPPNQPSTSRSPASQPPTEPPAFLQPPAVTQPLAEPRPMAAPQPLAARHPLAASHPLPTPQPSPPLLRPEALQPPPVEPPAAPAASPASQPPAAGKPRAATQPGSQPAIVVPRAATQPPVIQPPAEPSTGQPPAARAAPSHAPGPPGDTLPPPFLPRQAVQTAILGSASPIRPPAQVPPSAGSAPSGTPERASARAGIATEIVGSLSAVAENSPLAMTAFLGSNASAALQAARPASLPDPAAAASAPSAPEPPVIAEVAAASPSPVPLIAAAPATPPFSPGVGEATSFGPPEMPAPVSPVAASSPPGAALPAHPPRSSIANAETVETPRLAAPLEAQPVAELGMPPGITVAPASPPAPLLTADSSFEDAHPHGGKPGEAPHAEPAEVAALPHAERNTGGRDVLADWGWTTGTIQAIADEDDFVDTARASRRRLIIAIGGALGVVAIIAIVAFAFSGTRQPAEPGSQIASRPSPTAPIAPAPAEPPAAPPADPAATPAAAAPVEPGTAAAPPAETAAAAAAPVEPGTPPSSAPAADPSGSAPAEAARPAAGSSKPAAEPPSSAPAEAARPTAGSSKPAAEPKAIAANPSPAPTRPVAEPARPPRPTADAPRKPDKPARRPPPERVVRATRAQPVDPYAAVPEKPSADPAAVYRTGLQQLTRGDTAGALATFRALRSSNPGFAPTWRGLGVVYEKLGNKREAREAFKHYLQLAPGASDADKIRDLVEQLGP